MSKTARPTELKVKVISAKNLIAADSNGKSDPFAVVLTKSGSSGKDKSIKTKKISETLNPTWNETFNLILRDRKDSLFIEVWDDDLFGKDHLGTAEIPLEGLEHEKETTLVAKLNKQGEVSVALTIRFNDKEIEEHKQEEEKKRLAAEAQKKKEEEEQRQAAEEAARKQKEEEAKKQAAEAQKKKEEEEKKQAAEAQKKKEEEDRKKKEEEQKKAQQAAQAPAKAASAPATPAASSPVPPTAQTPAKASSAPATPATSIPAKPATTSTPASTTQTKASTPTTPAKQATKEAEGPNYVLIGGVVAVLAVAGFAAFKFLHKN